MNNKIKNLITIHRILIVYLWIIFIMGILALKFDNPNESQKALISIYLIIGSILDIITIILLYKERRKYKDEK